MIKRRLEAMMGVRAMTCWALIAGTFLLYYLDKTDAATGFMTLTASAVTWMFKSKADREHQEVMYKNMMEVKNGNQ